MREGGAVVEPTAELVKACLDLPRTLNVAILGAASRHLPFPEGAWDEAIAACVPPRTIEMNQKAFRIGREGAA